MAKIYIDNDGNFWNGRYVVINDMRIYNPSEEQLTEAGYTEYVAPSVPEPTEEELIEKARQQKLNDIEAYDMSDNVNSFTLGGMQMWLTVKERQQIATQITANGNVGRTEMTRWFGGHSFTFPLTTWEQMLVALEVYAGDALNVTEEHKAVVNSLLTREEIEEYDITAGYPEKLNFGSV